MTNKFSLDLPSNVGFSSFDCGTGKVESNIVLCHLDLSGCFVRLDVKEVASAPFVLVAGGDSHRILESS